MAAPTTVVDVLAHGGRGDPFPFRGWAINEDFRYRPEAAEFLSKCQSAAEAFFLREFTERTTFSAISSVATADGLTVQIQRRCGKYSLDCVVYHCPAQCLAVEIDGIEFHHRGPEQIAADYQRQCNIVAFGYPVIRFVVFEAIKQPRQCWQEVERVLAGLARQP